MKNRKISKNRTLLLAVGLLIMAMPSVLHRYMKLSDVVMGLSTGVGIGLMVLVLIRIRPNY